MLDLALALLLTAGPADNSTPTASDSITLAAPIAVPATPLAPHGDKHKKRKWRRYRKSQSNTDECNQPVPGPVPLALLGLGICGVVGARRASKRRRQAEDAEKQPD